MRIPGLARFRSAAKRLRNYLRSPALILLYHRVTELPSDPCLLSVTPRHFAEQLEVLRGGYRVLSLCELTRAAGQRRLPRGAVAVTFDDGYADNLDHAKPLLERFSVPATVYVATGYVGRKQEFFWDELDRIFLRPGTLPASLDLRVNGSTSQWELGEAAHYSEEQYQEQRRWSVARKDYPGPRQRLYRTLCQQLRPLAAEEQARVLHELRAWAKVGPEGRPSHRTLSAAEVSRLAEGGLVEVGAHTVTHAMLSARTPSEQQAEIEASKAGLEDLLGQPVRSFAYPYGSRSHYTPQTADLVRQAGFANACSNFEGFVRAGVDCFQLPRFMVLDWNGDEFARRIRQWFGN